MIHSSDLNRSRLSTEQKGLTNVNKRHSIEDSSWFPPSPGTDNVDQNQNQQVVLNPASAHLGEQKSSEQQNSVTKKKR